MSSGNKENGFLYKLSAFIVDKRSLFFLMYILSAVFCLFSVVLALFFSPQLTALFRDDPDVIACATAALRFQCISFPVHSWIVMSNMFQQVTGKTASATFLAMARQGIFYIPAVWILSTLFGQLGIQMTQMVSDLLTVACAIPLQLYILRRMPKKDHPLSEVKS